MREKVVGLGLIVLMGLLGLMLGLMVLVEPEVRAQAESERLVTVLASDERTADTTSADQLNIGPNLNVRGAYVTLDVTGVLTTPTITLTVQVKDSLSGQYEAIFTATSGVTTTGTHTYLIYPGVGSAGGDVVETLSYPMPPAWRVSVDHLDTDPITYSVGAMLLP